MKKDKYQRYAEAYKKAGLDKLEKARHDFLVEVVSRSIDTSKFSVSLATRRDKPPSSPEELCVEIGVSLPLDQLEWVDKTSHEILGIFAEKNNALMDKYLGEQEDSLSALKKLLKL